VASVGPALVRSGTESDFFADPWSNPGNVTAADAAYASASASGSGTNGLNGLDADLSAIPDGATIDGVEVTVQAKKTGANDAILSLVNLVVGGSVVGALTFSEATLTTTPTVYAAGGPTDKAGASFTAAQAKAATFGAQVQGYGILAAGQIDVDWIKIKVYYTAAAAASHNGLALLGVG